MAEAALTGQEHQRTFLNGIVIVEKLLNVIQMSVKLHFTTSTLTKGHGAKSAKTLQQATHLVIPSNGVFSQFSTFFFTPLYFHVHLTTGNSQILSVWT